MKDRKAKLLAAKKLLHIQLRFKLPCREANQEKTSFAAGRSFLWDMFSQVWINAQEFKISTPNCY